MRDAIEMARQAGWEMDDSLVLEPEVIWYMSQGQLERLVAIVRADEREIAIERAFVAMLGASHELTLRVVRAIRAGKT